MFLDRPLHYPSRHTAAGSPPWLFGLVFIAGLAIGTLIPLRGHVPRELPRAAVPTGYPASQNPMPPASMTWSREGNPSVHHSVEVVRVIDGDTFEARVHLWPGLEMTTRVRLRGIDAPEMKGTCGDEVRMAEVAAEVLRAQLADGDVTIFNIGPDKYNGRVVADASTRRTPSVSSALLASGHARQYRGGRRGGWCANERAG